MTNSLAIYNTSVDLAEIRRRPDLFPRIGTTPDDQAVQAMAKMVWAAFLYRGQEADTKKVTFIAEALVQEIKMDRKWGLPSLSWAEIGMTIRNAVLGSGSRELYGVSVASLYTALVDYAKGDGHDAARKALTPAPSSPNGENILADYAKRLITALKDK